MASANEHEVLKAWEGLGYYARARNLHKTAQLIQNALPPSVEELHALPGIGPSTANAIACFAFGVSVPILDGNVKRVLYRFYKTKVASDKELWVLSHRLFKQNIDYAYEHNQALMDIGSQVCTIRNPKCEICPLNEKCQGKNTPTEYPAKKRKKKKEIRHRYLIMYVNKNTFALFQNEQNLIKCKEIENKSPQSHYFIQFKKNIDIDIFINTYNLHITFEEENTVGPKSISKQELIDKLNTLFSQ